MRLIKPSLGECIDRLSILARKLEEKRQEDPECYAHWEEEEREIIIYAQPPLTKVAQILHLAAVNAMIWQEEELIAENPQHPGYRAYVLNRRRAELIAFISGLAASKEKI